MLGGHSKHTAFFSSVQIFERSRFVSDMGWFEDSSQLPESETAAATTVSELPRSSQIRGLLRPPTTTRTASIGFVVASIKKKR